MLDDANTPHYAAIVTPFDQDGAVDESALRALCEHLVSTPGVTGLTANANAAEVDALTHQERRRALQIAVEVGHAAGKLVMGGLAPQPSSFTGAAENAREFVDDGADSLLVLGPTAFARGIDLDPELAGAYVSHVHEASGVPLVYFLAGRLSGINYTPAVIAEIVKADGVVAVKDTMWTTEGFSATKAIIAQANPGVRVLSGNDNCVLSTMVAGADGTLLILNCLFGREIAEMHRAVQANDLESAQRLERRLQPVVEVIFQRPMLKMASRVKAALEHQGVIASARTRLPVPELTGEERTELETVMRKAGLV